MNQHPHDRDAWLEQPLREMLQAGTAADPTAACLDAGTLAAWTDDTLSAADRTAAEAHAAGCARCQAMLAAMARITPPPPARSWARLPVMGWLVPLAATGTALVVWMNVGSPARQPSERAAAPASAASAPVSVPEPPAQAKVAAPNVDEVAKQKRDLAPTFRDQLTLRDAPAGARERQNVAPAPGAVARLEKAQEAAVDQRPSLSADAFSEARRKDTVSPPPAPSLAAPAPAALAPAAPAAAAPPPPPAAAAGAARDAVAQRSAGVVAGAGAAAPAPRAASEKKEADAAAPKLASSSLAENATVARLAMNAPRQQVIVSPDPKSRWLIAPSGGTIQRSIDGGTTWLPQPTGAGVALTAGASPAPLVCWLVGPAGTVLLSTDGQAWRRIPFPEVVDLASVIALSDKAATVATADGRTFSTNDGGAKWTPSRTR